MNNSIKKIVIVGRDADAWLTGMMLKRGFPSPESSVEVELLELPSILNENDFFSVLPTHKILHRALGAQEISLLRSSKGLPFYGHRFSNWTANGEAYHSAYDRFGVDFEGVDFIQFWIKAAASGLKVPLEDFNLGVAASKQNRKIELSSSSNEFSHASNGFHLSAKEYIRSVAGAAIREGLQYRNGSIQTVSVNNGMIQEIQLTDGTKITADFFIDASGAEAILIKELEGNNWQSWGDYLPVDRLIVASAPVMKPMPPFCQNYALSGGWIGLYPMLNRTGVNIAYASKYENNINVRKEVAGLLGIEIRGQCEKQIESGIRKKHWIGNCLAIGETAVSMEPLEATQLHALNLGLSLLKSLFPVDRNYMPAANIYNEKIIDCVESTRNFQIAHYALNKRYGEPFWDYVRQVTLPSSLRDKIDLFKSRGIISMQENETFQEENWIALFIGHGICPVEYNQIINGMADDVLIVKFRNLLHCIKTEVEKMPDFQAYVDATFS
jgi:tryptophan halogenase